MKLNFKIISLPLILSALFILKVTPIFAQVTSSSVAVSSPVSDNTAQSGDVICTYKDGNRRCNTEYDSGMYGIISDNPAASITDSDLKNARLIITSGVVAVRVSTVNGAVKAGDFLTSSVKDGVSEKASDNGYVLGVALEDYNESDTSKIGNIQAMVNIHPEAGLTGSRGNLIQFIRKGLTVPVYGPVESLRYLLAIAIVLISFVLGMIYFGRASRAGIEAIGRNPLAKKVIQLTVVLNISLTIVIVLVGLGIAYLILML
jgi:hypothetical protein